MNTFIFENNTINSIEVSSNTPTKLKNNNSDISYINSLETTVVLSGSFNCDLKFINSSSINIESDFYINSGIFFVINNENSMSTFYIIGVLNPSISDFTLNCSTNTRILHSFFGSKSSNVTINCNIKSEFSDKFIIAPYNSTASANKLLINLNNAISKKLEIFSDLKSLDLTTLSQVDLFIAPAVKINNFFNFTFTSLSTLSCTPDLAEEIKKQNFLTSIPLKSIPFKVRLEDGKGILKIPKVYNMQNLSASYVFLGANKYSISIK